jgi:ribonuclease Z
MLLTLADVQEFSKSKVQLHGPPTFNSFVASLRHFIPPSSLSFNTNEISCENQSTCVQDENLTITPIIITPTGNQEATLKNSKVPIKNPSIDLNFATSPKLGQKRQRSRSPVANKRSRSPSSKDLLQPISPTTVTSPILEHSDCTTSDVEKSIRRSPSPVTDARSVARFVRYLEGSDERLGPGGASAHRTQEFECTVAYICLGPSVLGKFNKEKAVQLGIKPGRVYGTISLLFPSNFRAIANSFIAFLYQTLNCNVYLQETFKEVNLLL